MGLFRFLHLYFLDFRILSIIGACTAHVERLYFSTSTILGGDEIISFLLHLDFVGFPVLSVISGCIPRVEWFFYIWILSFF